MSVKARMFSTGGRLCGDHGPLEATGASFTCINLPNHSGMHHNALGTVWENQSPAYNPAAPQVHQVTKCANMLCSNKPGEGTFTIFSMLLERHPIALALCAPCGETLKARARW